MEALSGAKRGPLAIAAVAGLVASGADGLLLYVVNAARPALALAPPPSWALPVGTVLGVVAIPLYALGYRELARALGARTPTDARVVQGAGAVAAMLGAIIHGLTGRLIAQNLSPPGPARPPFEAMMAWEGSPLPALWALATLLVVAASVAMARAAGEDGLPLTARLFNPAALTLVLGLGGLGSELGRSFLTPAAPNLAHALCFAWATRALVPGRGMTGATESRRAL